MALVLRNSIDCSEPLKRARLLLKVVIWLAIVIFAVGIFWHNFGVVLNITDSMPKGIYVYAPVSTIKRGQTVLVEMRHDSQAMQINRKRGYAIEGTRWVKAVIGVPGDSVNTQGLVTSVCHKGHCHAFRCLKHDRYDRPLSCHHYHHLIIPKDQYFLAGTNSPKSFDSRYFGLGRRSEIVNTAWRL